MDQIRFKSGEFQSFTATRSFALGNFNVRIENGTELEFDGSTVKYAGSEYAFPQLRAALPTGWIVLTKNYDANNPEYGKPLSARIQVHSATQANEPRSMIATVDQDEHIVMNSNTHASQTKVGNRRTASQAGSEGVAVRTLKTPAVSSSTDVTAAQAVLSALDRLEITPGHGITVEEMMGRMSEAEREAYVIKKAAAKASYGHVAPTKSGSGKVVGKVKTTAGPKTTEGMTATSSTGGGIETWDSGDANVVATIGGEGTDKVVEDGITFSNTGIPARPAKKQPVAKPLPSMSIDVRRRIARALCPDFPDSYDFAASTKKKLARLQADFDGRLDVLRAVFAAEEDLIKSQILELFPEAFA